MNGYPFDFGITECIKLCASSTFADKRVAYLGLTILVNETEEILMLMTNSLKQDLNNVDINIVTLALNVVGDVASPEMLRDLLLEIEKHMQSPNPQIRKKAGLTAVRAVRKLPSDETAMILEQTPAFFDTRSSAVHISGATLVSALCEQDPNNAVIMHETVLPILISILSDHLNGIGPSRPADLYGSTHERENPFLLAKLITALRSLLQYAPGAADVQTAENIGSLLVSLAKKFDPNGSGSTGNTHLKMIQCSILYEIVRASAYVRAHSPDLKHLITQILGRFLAHKEATVRYIALQELNALADIDGVSALAEVSQLDEKLLSSLREADRTVRRQGAELVFRTTNSSNVQKMVSEMSSYVSLSGSDSDSDAVRDGCEKLFLMADQYGGSEEWILDVFVNALTLGHRHIPNALTTCLVSFISAHPAVRAHAVHTLFEAVLRPHAIAAIDAMNAYATNSANLLDGVADHSTIDEKNDSKNSKLPARRMLRAETVALYVIGEFQSTSDLSNMDVVNSCDALIFRLDEVSKSGSEDEDTFANDVAAVKATALSTLLKIAARELGVTGGDASIYGANDGGLADMFAGLGIPALPAPPSSNGGEAANGQNKNAGAELAMQLVTMGETGAEPTGKNSSAVVTDLVALGLDGENDDAKKFGAMTVYDGDSGAYAEGGPIVAKIRSIFTKLVTSADIELQQRACEYITLLENSAEARAALGTAAAPAAPMKYIGVRAVCNQFDVNAQPGRISRTRPRSRGTPIAALGTGNADLLLDFMDDEDDNTGNATTTVVDDDDPLAILGALVVADPQPVQAISGPPLSDSNTPVDDLFAMTMGGSRETMTGETKATGAGEQNNPLDSLMGLDVTQPTSSTPETNSAMPPSETPDVSSLSVKQETESELSATDEMNGERHGERHLIRDGDAMRLEIDLGGMKMVGDEACRQCLLIMSNLSDRRATECVLQLAVPKYMRLEMDPASGSEVDPGGTIQQTIRMYNRAHGTKPLQFRYILGFLVEGNEELTRLQGLADNLP